MTTPTKLADRPGRGGLTVDSKGTEAVLGFWPEALDGAEHVSGLRAQFSEVVRIAQRHHERNRAIIHANSTRTAPAVTDPHTEAQLSRAEQKKIAAAEDAIQRASAAVFDRRARLQPWGDYFKESGLLGHARNAELRAALRAMPNEQARLEAVKRFEFRRAALEPDLAPELSGLRPATYQRLLHEEKMAQFPGDMKVAADQEAAVEVLRLSLKAARTAVDNTLRAVGQPVVERAVQAPPSKAWA